MSLAERFARWEGHRYGLTGRSKPWWAWRTEALLFGWWRLLLTRDHHLARMFLADPPEIDQ